MSWLLLQPIDVMKSLYQAAPESLPASERTMRALLSKSYAEEGPRFLFRGLVPTCLRAFPASAVIFLVYEWCIHLLGGDDSVPDGVSHT